MYVFFWLNEYLHFVFQHLCFLNSLSVQHSLRNKETRRVWRVMSECCSHPGRVDQNRSVEVGSPFTPLTSENHGERIASFARAVCASVALFSLHKWRFWSVMSGLVWSLCWILQRTSENTHLHRLPWQPRLWFGVVYWWHEPMDSLVFVPVSHVNRGWTKCFCKAVLKASKLEHGTWASSTNRM